MGSITTWLGGLSGPVIYAVVGALVFLEDGIFVGFVLPGETAVVLGGVLASQGKVDVWVLALVVVLAAILGDSVGYEIGKKLGPSILDVKPLRPHRERVGAAQDLIRRRGPWAVFLGRFIAFFRAMMPALAGVSRMPYGTFLRFNALGGAVWGVGFVLLGYFAGHAYQRIEKQVGTVVAVVVAAVVVGAFVVWHVRRRRAERAAERAAAQRRGVSDPTDEPA
jgi:membrane protein DedA with SNARE-associated domain